MNTANPVLPPNNQGDTPMPAIWIRVTSGITGTLRTQPSEAPFVFNIRDLEHIRQLKVEVSSDGERVTATGLADASDPLCRALEQTPPEADLSLELESEVLRLVRPLSYESHRVLQLTQQESQDPSMLPHNECHGILGGLEWSQDCLQWRQLPLHKGSCAISDHAVGILDNRLFSRVQALLDVGEQPLLAYKHLYHAERSDGLRFKWIEATTAAELAIKEVLARLKPSIRPILMALPSPPIRKLYGTKMGKLYGTTLEAYANERSPYVGDLDKGATIRNQLIHQPEDIPLDHQKVLNYIATVRYAIRHLLELQRRLCGSQSPTAL